MLRSRWCLVQELRRCRRLKVWAHVDWGYSGLQRLWEFSFAEITATNDASWRGSHQLLAQHDSVTKCNATTGKYLPSWKYVQCWCHRLRRVCWTMLALVSSLSFCNCRCIFASLLDMLGFLVVKDYCKTLGSQSVFLSILKPFSDAAVFWFWFCR